MDDGYLTYIYSSSVKKELGRFKQTILVNNDIDVILSQKFMVGMDSLE